MKIAMALTIKVCLAVALLVVPLIVSCAPSERITDDIYLSRIYPEMIGSEASKVDIAYFRSLHVDNETLYIGGIPFTSNNIKGFVWKGSWQSDNYSAYDVIQYDGSCYVCTESLESLVSPDTDPDHWGLVASKGSQGIPGLSGENGTAGSNEVTGGTTTTFAGLLKGSSGYVAQAIIDTDYSPPYANKSILSAITEAFTTTLKNTYDSLVSSNHTHSNLAILKNITEAFTTALKTSYDVAVAASHSHSNKALLDTYTQTETNLADAVSKKHSHTNQTVLDATTASFTTALKTSYDWLVTNITSAWKTLVDNFIASKGVASGLAPLDANSRVPIANLGSGTASSSTYLRGDQTWATPAGGGSVATDVIWDAKGDLAVATGSDAAVRLAAGSNGQVLTADSTQTGGMKWNTPTGGGESEVIIVMPADVANATTTLANATGMTFNAEANSEYIIEGFILWNTSATAVGIKISATATNSPTIQAGHFITDAAAGTPDSSSWNANDVTVTTSASPYATYSMGKVEAVLKTAASASTWTLRFAAETTGTITVKAGSVLRYRKVA